MGDSMQQWWVVPGDGGGSLELRDVEVPRPAEGEVLIEVRAAGVNRGELMAMAALRRDRPTARAYRSGIEAAGVVAAVGANVDRWAPGDRVMARGVAGHATYALAPADAVLHSPTGLPSVEAAAIPNTFITAHDALVTTAAVGPTDRVLVTAGSSGVGTAAIQIARYLGCSQVAATTRAAHKADDLLGLGATEVIDTSVPTWTEAFVERDRGSFDVVIDQVGGQLFADLLRVMDVTARYVSVGRNDGAAAAIDLDLVARRRLTLLGVTFRTRTEAEALACSKRFGEALLPAFDSGRLLPVVDRSVPFDQLPEAHSHLRSNTQVGKVVLLGPTPAT